MHNQSPVIDLIGRTQQVSFVISALLGVIAAGLIALLAAGALERGTTSANGTGIYALLLVAAALMMLGLFFSAANVTLGFPERYLTPGGLLFGLGGMLLCLLWARAYAHAGVHRLFAYTVASLLMGVLLFALSFVLHTKETCFLYAAVLIVLSTVALFPTMQNMANQPTPTGDKPSQVRASGKATPAEAPDAADMETGTRTFLATTWMSLAGAVICSLVLGLIWDPILADIAADQDFSLLITSVSGTVPLLLALLIMGHLHPSEHLVTRFCQIALPLAAAFLLLFPYIESLNSATSFISAAGKEASFAIFFIAAWVSCALAARGSGARTWRVFGVLFMVLAMAMLAGLFLIPRLGEGGKTLLSVAWILYLTAIAIYYAVIAVRQTAVPAAQPVSIENALGTRATELAASAGLSPRETEVLVLLARGHSYAHIATVLSLFDNTVKTHARNIYAKLGIGSREELFALMDARPDE